MNFTDVAKEIAKREGKKKQIDIAQVKEILRILGDVILERTDGEVYRVNNFMYGILKPAKVRMLKAKKRAK